jgi:Uma2 family endonuclease
MHATTRFTAADLASLPGPDRPHEIWRADLRLVSPATLAHGSVCSRLLAALAPHVHGRGLGELVTEGTAFWLERDPDMVFCPDIAFVAKRRLAVGDMEAVWAEIAPDLAIEVLSPSDHPGRMRSKVAEYLRLGVGAVWVVDPKARRILVHTRAARPAGIARATDRGTAAVREFSEGEDLDGGEILPGFRCPVAAVFAGLPR